MPTRIDTDTLRTLRACEAQVNLFTATFPEGVTVTPDNAAAVAEAAAQAGLNVDWYARRVLTPEERAAYDAATAPARAAYDEAEAQALCAILAAVAEARAAYRAAVAEALCFILATRP